MDKRTQNAFLGKARHNLKNPVNAILGYSEMLIEDCEDEGFISLIPDIRKLNQAGNDILSSIEEIFSDKALADSENSISGMAKEMEIALRTPLNTIIGYSELLIEESDSVTIDNFKTDIDKIFVYGKKVLNTYKYTNKHKRGNILQSINDFDEVFSDIIKRNDYLMIKGSNATGLNKLSNRIIKGYNYVI